MDHLPLERCHRLQPLWDTRLADLLGRLPAQFGQLLPAARPVATHVKHDPAARTGLTVHCQPGELLQRFQHLTVRPDQFCQGGADDGDDRPLALDIHVNVTVKVRYVEQALDVVGRDLALLLQIGRAGCVLVLRRLIRARGFG